MNERALWLWAVGATVVAVGAVSFSVGKHFGATTVTPVSASASLNTTNGADANVPLPGLVIPDVYKGAPKEWRSRLSNNETRGYAILFDPAGDKLIVEDCAHKGYHIDSNGRPIRPSGEFCESVIWTSVVSLADDKMVVKTKQGKTIEIALDLDKQAALPLLSMSFDGHKAYLIPGSKQDLFVAMENLEEIAEQKEAYHQALLNPMPLSQERLAADKLEEQRRQQQASASEQTDLDAVTDSQIPADIPRYVIQEVSPATE